MARFDADTNGAIVKFVATYAQELLPGPGAKPAGTVYSVQFDEATNPGLVTAYQSNPSQFSLAGNTLTQTPPGGQPSPATVNPPGPFYDAFQRSRDILSRLTGDQAAIAAAAFRAHGFPVG